MNLLVKKVGRVRQWDELRKGQKESFTFFVSPEEMKKFAELSGDTSRIHFDAEFAQKNGFEEPVVFGALIVSKLSYFVGMQLPGDLGLATDWQLDFRRPLYVNREALFTGEIVHLSPATNTIRIDFCVEEGNDLIASGVAGSRLLQS